MTSWRESASPQAQDDLDGLLDAALPFAQQQLERYGEFLPYGVAVGVDGTQRMIAGDPDGGEHPASLDVLAVMVDGLRSQRDELRAVVLVSDVRLAESDAIRVELEHREGAALAVFLPYSLSRIRKRVDYGGLAASAGTQHVWSEGGG